MENSGKMKKLFAVIILILISQISVAEDWPMFHYDSKHTGETSDIIENPENLELNWKFKTGGLVGSSPAVYGDYVYIENHAPEGGELRILNVSNPSQISQVGLYDEGSFVFAAYANDTIAYLADYKNGLIVVNVTNVSNPTRIAQFFNGGHTTDVYVINNIAYIADGNDGLEIIKILI